MGMPYTLVVVFVAQVLPVLVAAAAAGVWWTVPLGDKVTLGFIATAALAIAAVLVAAAAAAHQDPRPFVVDPSHPALFSHPSDNGFPSDHTTFTAATAMAVAVVRRRTGAALSVLAVACGLARVAANVHHLQDVGAGLAIAAVAVLAARALWLLLGYRPGARGDLRRGRPRVMEPKL